MKHSIKTKMTLIISAIALIVVVSVTSISSAVIDKQFKQYITKQQEINKDKLVTELNQQYDKETNTWKLDLVHTIGMSAIYDGYIIKVYDEANRILWDAESHDMSLCNHVMDEVTARMQKINPNGKITSETHPMSLNGQVIGTVEVKYYGPFFLSENDSRFLNTLTYIFIFTGVVTLALSFIIGLIASKRISDPILKTVDVTRQIAEGKYDARIDEKTNTLEIDGLIESINHLAQSLQRQEILRKQLTEDVSHELRTPISILQSHLEAMTDGIWPATKEKLESCNEEVKRIGSLIQDLEKLAVVDSGNLKLNKTQVNLKNLIRHVVNSFKIQLDEKNIKLSIYGDCPDVPADYVRIIQVVFNLVSNAVKYTDQNGTIVINISETEDYSCFSIQDNGIGIAKEDLSYIFERFYRTDKSHSRKTGGSGLGLSIAKSIIDEHNGKIEVTSEINKGSTFIVMLPKK